MKVTFNKDNSREQLQFVLSASLPPRPHFPRRPCPQAKARWWFQQMRRLVDEAPESVPAVPTRHD
jgi:hypothetical protein